MLVQYRWKCRVPARGVRYGLAKERRDDAAQKVAKSYGMDVGEVIKSGFMFCGKVYFGELNA